ncbi:hypothetical protein Ciccas_010145 [Cichlidogyrus casuarinus]|uniref:RRM domain-containing protein n=1 Tax=Cichlidogyrus casuarinus TaxID=1844966 RepID=A0ABD2PVQ6_9PLAT
MKFFNDVGAKVLGDNQQSIFFVSYRDKRPTGDAFVIFETELMANKALTRHKDYLGDRYVELFKASPSEMIQVCNNVLNFNNASGPSNLTPTTQGTSLLSNNLMMLNNTLDPSASSLIMAMAAQRNPDPLMLLTQKNPINNIEDPTDPTDPTCPFAKALPPGGATGLIQISGLPIDTSRAQIRMFLGVNNLAKVFRLRRIENSESLIQNMVSTWLLSVLNTETGVQLIQDLIHQQFTTVLGSFLLPSFALFGVNPLNAQLYPIPLVEQGLPVYRVLSLCGGSARPDKLTSPSNAVCQGEWKIAKNLIKNLMRRIPKRLNAVSDQSMKVTSADTGSPMILIHGAPIDTSLAEILSLFGQVSQLLSVSCCSTISSNV